MDGHPTQVGVGGIPHDGGATSPIPLRLKNTKSDLSKICGCEKDFMHTVGYCEAIREVKDA